METRIKNILRWILVLPASFLSFYLVGFLVRLWYPKDANWFDFQDLIDEIIINIIICIANGSLFVYVGTFIAPKHKKEVSIILVSILSTILIILIALMIHVQATFPYLTPIWTIIIIISAICMCIYLVRKYKKS